MTFLSKAYFLLFCSIFDIGNLRNFSISEHFNRKLDISVRVLRKCRQISQRKFDCVEQQLIEVLNVKWDCLFVGRTVRRSVGCICMKSSAMKFHKCEYTKIYLIRMGLMFLKVPEMRKKCIYSRLATPNNRFGQQSAARFMERKCFLCDFPFRSIEIGCVCWVVQKEMISEWWNRKMVNSHLLWIYLENIYPSFKRCGFLACITINAELCFVICGSELQPFYRILSWKQH